MYCHQAKESKAIFAYYSLREYEDFKVENVLLNLHCETLSFQEGELVKLWEEVHDMFKEDLQ
jgi:hypothetical protein